MRRSPARSLRRRRLLVAAPILLAVLVLGAAGWLLHDARRAAWDQAVRTTGNLAMTLERDISRNVEIYNLSLSAATKAYSLPDWPAMSPAVQQAMLFDGAIQAGHFGAIMVTDEAGRVVHASSTLTPEPTSVADRDYFQAHRADPRSGLIVSLVPRNRLTGLPAIQLSRRIDRPDGSFAGVVVGAINVDYVQGLFGALRLGDGGTAALFMADGRLVARLPAAEGDFGRPLGSLPVFGRLAEAPSGSYVGAGGVDRLSARLVTYRRVGALPLVLVLGTSLDTVYAGWVGRLWGFGTVLLALCALAVVLALGLRRELRRRAEAERGARASEAKLQAFFDHLADGLMVLRVDPAVPGGGFAVEAMNEAAAAMLALPAGGGTRRDLAEIWPAEQGGLLDHLHRCLADGQSARYEVSSKVGTAARELRITIAPVVIPAADPAADLVADPAADLVADSGAGPAAGAVAVQAGASGHAAAPGARVQWLLVSMRDVTERVRMDEQLHQTQRMESLGQLTAGIAHDFNNLLQAQMGSLELLLDELHDRPAAQEYAVTALQAGERGARLTHYLLAFSRKQVLHPQVIDLNGLLGRFRLMLGRLLEGSVQVRVEVAAGTAAPLADPAQLEAALLNLALNARDAMAGSGTLLVEAYDARGAPDMPAPVLLSPVLAPVLSRGGVVLAVTDTGGGMSPDTLARACEPFFTTKGVKGSGLGLSMVQGFARQSGGELRITSSPARGTRVEIWLPRAESGVAGLVAANAGRARGVGRLLLVDDTPEVLATMSEVLEDAGFTVTPAASADEALSIMAGQGADGAQCFDALLTDYAMPGMNGVELVHAASRLQPDLPALVITGFADADPRGRLPPHVRVANKPLRADALVRHVLEIVPQGRAARGEIGSGRGAGAAASHTPPRAPAYPRGVH